jgi:hypothetical protein
MFSRISKPVVKRDVSGREYYTTTYPTVNEIFQYNLFVW